MNDKNNDLWVQVPVILLIPLVLTIVPIFFLGRTTESYCSNSQTECINLWISQIPLDAGTSIIGSFVGVAWTFTALYILELIKQNNATNKLSISFEPQQEPNEYIHKVEKHNVYIDGQYFFVGENIYVKVKVNNSKSQSIRECRVFLNKITKIVDDKKEIILKDFQPLLWSYESPSENNFGKTLSSKGTAYADLLVSYPQDFTPESLPKTDENNKKIWYLKPKIKNRDRKFCGLISIKEDQTQTYVFALIICGDQCEPKTIDIEIQHNKGSSDIYFNQCSFTLPCNLDPNKLSYLKGEDKNKIINQIYDYL